MRPEHEAALEMRPKPRFRTALSRSSGRRVPQSGQPQPMDGPRCGDNSDGRGADVSIDQVVLVLDDNKTGGCVPRRIGVTYATNAVRPQKTATVAAYHVGGATAMGSSSSV